MDTELAWAAGFIDGEGSFGIQRQKGKKDIAYLQAGQTDREVLDRLQATIADGKVYGPYTPRRKNDQPYYYYRLTGNKRVEEAGLKIYPWLSSRKKEQYGRAIRQLATEPVLKTVEVNSP